MIDIIHKLMSGRKRESLARKPYVYPNNSGQAVRGRALLSYLVTPLIEDANGIPTTQFSNNGAGRAWGRVLAGLGYQVDVINWDDVDFVPKDKYDVIVIHGGKNYMNLVDSLRSGGKIIYYSTGSYWVYHNNQELRRFAEFKDRSNVSLLPDRLITDSEEVANTIADAIISLGNKDAAATYAKFPHVYNLEGATYEQELKTTHFGSEAAKHFLFMSGPGNIHKGLDIAIEAFRDLPEYHLHIMMSLDHDFAEHYRVDLERPNIHPHGYVEQRSPDYYKVVRKCGYIMLLSCSEGSPGSVIEGMTQGLIPLVSRDSHINLPKAGVTIVDVSVSNVKRVIRSAGKKSQKDISLRSAEVLKYVQDHLGIDRFDSELTTILKSILGAGV